MQFTRAEGAGGAKRLARKLSPHLGCEFSAPYIASGRSLNSMPDDIAGHIDSCTPCQRRLSGAQGLN